MLTAYYSRGCNSKEMFSSLKIADYKDFERHLNQYNVIYINMMYFFSEYDDTKEMLTNLQKEIMFEIIEEFPDVRYYDETKLMRSLKDVFAKYQTPFIFIIDEWDFVLRDKKNDSIAQETYLKFLSALFKNQSYLALVYMTGILPIKKYGGHSAINAFYEYSMTDAEPISEFTGFTEIEVKKLCEKYKIIFGNETLV